MTPPEFTRILVLACLVLRNKHNLPSQTSRSGTDRARRRGSTVECLPMVKPRTSCPYIPFWLVRYGRYPPPSPFPTLHQTSWPLFGCLTLIIGEGLNEVWKPRLRCFSFVAYKYPWAILVGEARPLSPTITLPYTSPNILASLWLPHSYNRRRS